MDRKQYIIELLRVKQSWMTGNELAQLTNVTQRTIRQDMKQLRELYGAQFLLVSKKYGYRLADYTEQMQATDETQQYTRKLRLLTLWKQLFFEQNISIYEIADKFFVSESTIMNDMTYIRAQLATFNKHSYSIQRNGEYHQLKVSSLKCKIACDFYDFALKKLHVQRLDEFASVFDEFCLKELYRCCVEVLYTFDMSYQYISFIALAVELATCIVQNKWENSEEIVMQGVCCESVTALQAKIKQQMQIHLTHNQCIGIYLTLVNTQAMAQYERELRLNGRIEPEFEAKILKVFMQYYVPLKMYAQDQSEILRQFLCHLQLAREKQRRGFYTINPLLNQLQREHAMLFEIARRALRSIGLEFDENECSYVVIYLQLLFEHYIQREATGLTIQLVVTNSYSNGLYLQTVLTQYMNDVDDCTLLRDLPKQLPTCDIVFSTSHVARKYPMTVMISKQIDAAQALKIKVTINQIRQQKCLKYMRQLQRQWEQVDEYEKRRHQPIQSEIIEHNLPNDTSFQQAILYQYCLEFQTIQGYSLNQLSAKEQLYAVCEAYMIRK